MYPRADRKRGDSPACETTVVANKILGRLFMVATETREHGGFLSRRRVSFTTVISPRSAMNIGRREEKPYDCLNPHT